MNILICDDQKDYLNLIEKKVREGYKDEMVMKLYAYAGSRQLKRSLHARGYQLAYIEMKTEENIGIELAKLVLKKNPGCRIIFVCDQYLRTHEAFELGAFYYLKRPLCTEEFNRVLTKAVEDYKDQDVSFYLHTDESRNCILNTKDIKYIQTYYYDLEITTYDKVLHTDIKNRYVIRPYLTPRHFVQVNQSIMVNMHEIDFLTEKCVILKNREVFNIGITKTMKVHLKYEEYKRKMEKNIF